MKTPTCLLRLVPAALCLLLAACASNPRTVARESYAYQGDQTVARGPAPTSDEDLRRLRGGRERSTATSSSSTQVNRSGQVKAKSSDTEVIDTITETVVEMTPVASGDAGF
jgi:hypothetical protein